MRPPWKMSNPWKFSLTTTKWPGWLSIPPVQRSKTFEFCFHKILGVDCNSNTAPTVPHCPLDHNQPLGESRAPIHALRRWRPFWQFFHRPENRKKKFLQKIFFLQWNFFELSREKFFLTLRENAPARRSHFGAFRMLSVNPLFEWSTTAPISIPGNDSDNYRNNRSLPKKN